MLVWLEDSEGVLCFKHAVEKSIKGEHIEIKAADENDSGQSGCWWLGGCYECEKESKND